MNRGGEHNLSATRGNVLGIAFFRLLLGCCGLRVACWFVAPVTWFYTLFDRRARRAALPYIQAREPGISGIRRLLAVHRLLTAQGEALLIARRIGDAGWSIPFVEESRDAAAALLRDSSRGLVIVCSHFGCWQAAMAGLAGFNRRVNLLVDRDVRAAVGKRMAIPGVRDEFREIIAGEAPGGGLLECISALSRGEIVCVMGDRTAGGPGVEMAFLGGRAKFPPSPWVLAARAGVPVTALFIPFEDHGRRLVLSFGSPVRLPAPEHKVTPEDIREPMARYVAELESFCRRYPDQCFRFEPETFTTRS